MTSRFDQLGRHRRRRRLGGALIFVVIVSGLTWFGLGWRVGAALRAAQDAMVAGQPAEATARLEAARFWYRHAARVTEAEGILALLNGDTVRGRALLDEARALGVGRSGLDLDVIGRHLADHARYVEVGLLASHREATGSALLPPLWRAEATLAGGDLEQAARLLQAAEIAGGDTERRERLAALLAERRGQGVAWSVSDRHGRRLLGRTLDSGETVTEIPELGEAPLATGGALDHLDGRALGGRVRLTIDLAYQRAAHAALGRHAGAFIAIDPSTGGLLALVNHPGPQVGGGPAFQRLHEPGSIVKMLTLAAALDGDLDLDGLFPVNCAGNMTLDSQVFYDWTVHDTVEDIGKATAVSCNLTFAAIGLELGQARLDDTLRRFGFDASPVPIDLALGLGRTLDIDALAPRRGLALRSVGLGNLTMTPLHVALLGATFANGGTAMRPHIVGTRSALGTDTPYMSTEPASLFVATSPETSGSVGEAMRRVVLDPAGTGRRAAVPDLDFVMKTGTAGERSAGLNSIIFGWAPVDNPVVAFGFIAEHAGKAELEGARIVRDFLTTVRNEFGRTP